MSKKHKKSYALKEMSKVRIIDRKSEKSITYERELLSKLKHPYAIIIIKLDL
jgi:serine/threonine protein kinase